MYLLVWMARDPLLFLLIWLAQCQVIEKLDSRWHAKKAVDMKFKAVDHFRSFM